MGRQRKRKQAPRVDFRALKLLGAGTLKVCWKPRYSGCVLARWKTFGAKAFGAVGAKVRPCAYRRS
eukprot:15469732-Alexandrium_andersonii.AAC.1